MDFSQYIGFIISFLALAFLLFQRIREERYRRNHPQEYEAAKRKKEEQMKAFLRSLEVGEGAAPSSQPLPKPLAPLLAKKKKEIPPPAAHLSAAAVQSRRVVDDDFRFQPTLEGRHQKTAIEERTFKTKIEDRYKDPFGDHIVSIDLRQKGHPDSYQVISKQTSSPVSRLIKGLPSQKEMVILYEVFGRPGGKSL